MRIVTSDGVGIVPLNEQTIVQYAFYTLDDSHFPHRVTGNNDIANHWNRALKCLNTIAVSKGRPHTVAMHPNLNPSQPLNSHESKKSHFDP